MSSRLSSGGVREPMLDVVERLGVEFSVTLLVDGIVITGLLSPYLCYLEWTRHQIALALALGGRFDENGGHLPSITADETARVRALYRERLQDAGIDPDSEEAKRVELPRDTMCLRNAVLQIGAPDAGTWRHMPFLAIATDAVAACTPMIWGPQVVFRPAPGDEPAP